MSETDKNTKMKETADTGFTPREALAEAKRCLNCKTRYAEPAALQQTRYLHL